MPSRVENMAPVSKVLKSMNSPAIMRSRSLAGTGGKDEVGSSVVSRGGGLRVIVVGSEVPGGGMVGINADASESWSSC